MKDARMKWSQVNKTVPEKATNVARALEAAYKLVNEGSLVADEWRVSLQGTFSAHSVNIQ
jgi:hypothetical protein